MFDSDILAVVSAEMESGSIAAINDLAPYAQAMERGFPMAMNRISWEKRPDAQRLEIFPAHSGERHAEEVETRLENVREQVSSWLTRAGVEPDAGVVWMGDHTDIGLRMTVEHLLAHFPALFALPQHSYVVPIDGSWCLNYVMEGELFFGRSRNDSRSRANR